MPIVKKGIVLGCMIGMIMSLQACMSAAMTGAQAVYHRHGLQRQFHDQYVAMQVFKALEVDHDQFSNANIAIAVFNDKVLLAGQVPEVQQKQEALRIVKSLPEVKEVYNLITVSNPSSSLTRISDAWLTAKIKAKMLASNDVDASQIKVVTENGTVYLMGILQPDEAKAAVDLARSTDGVDRVVKIFSYLRISQR